VGRGMRFWAHSRHSWHEGYVHKTTLLRHQRHIIQNVPELGPDDLHTKKNAASAVCENHSVHATTPLLLFLRITWCSWGMNTRWGWSRRCGCLVGWPAPRSKGRGHRTATPKHTSYRTTYSCHHKHPRAFRAGGHK
jgi:hypothetical protein